MDPRLTRLFVADSDPHEQIARLEGEIDRLAEAAERCRKIAVVAKVAIGAGAVLLGAVLLGMIRPDGLIVAATLVIGGIVVVGSNGTTAKQLAGRIEEAERLRAELIGRIELYTVAEPRRLLH